MAMQPSTRANVVLSLVDKMSPALRKVSAKLDRMAVRARRAGMAMGAAAVVLGTGLYQASKSAVELDTNMRKVEARTKGITASGLEELNKEALRLGRETRYTAGEVSSLMATLAQAGESQQSILGMTSQMLDFATATGVAADEAAGFAINALNQFGMEHTLENVTKVTDSMTYAVNNAKLTVVDLGEAMKYAGSLAKEYGQTFNDTMAGIALMGNVGITGTMAGTTFNAMFRELASGSQTLDDWGVSVRDAATGEMLTLPQIFLDLNEAMEMRGVSGLDKMQAFADIFKRLGAKGAVIGAREIDKLLEMSASMENISGYTKKTADIMDSGMYGTLVRVKSALDGVAIAIGNSIMPYVEAVSKKLTGWLNKLTPMIESTKGLGLAIAGVFAALAGGAIGLLTFAGVATVAATIVSAIGSMVTGIIAFGGFVSGLSLPFVAIAAAVTGVVVVISKGIMKSKAFGQAWDNVGKGGTAAMNSINAAFGGLVSAISSGDLELAWDIVLAGIDVSTRELLDSMFGLWRPLVAYCKTSMAAINLLIDNTTGKIANMVDLLMIFGGAGAQSLPKSIQALNDLAVDSVDDTAQGLHNALTELTKSLVDTATSTDQARAKLNQLILQADKGAKAYDGTEQPFAPSTKPRGQSDKSAPLWDAPNTLKDLKEANDENLKWFNENFKKVNFDTLTTSGALTGGSSAAASANLARGMNGIMKDQLGTLVRIEKILKKDTPNNSTNIWAP